MAPLPGDKKVPKKYDQFGQLIPPVKYPRGVKKNLGMKDPPEVTPALAAEATKFALDAGTVRDPNLPPPPPEVQQTIYPAELPDLRWPVPPNPWNPPKNVVEYRGYVPRAGADFHPPKGTKPVTVKQMQDVDEKLKHLKIHTYYAYNIDPEAGLD